MVANERKESPMQQHDEDMATVIVRVAGEVKHQADMPEAEIGAFLDGIDRLYPPSARDDLSITVYGWWGLPTGRPW